MINHIYDILKKPVLSEKSNLLEEKHKYTFIVQCNANKKVIKKAIENIFKIIVTNINIINIKSKVKKFKGKQGCIQAYKKVIVSVRNKLDYNTII